MVDSTGQRVTVTVINRRGLHARAASRFVKVASGFTAKITVAREDEPEEQAEAAHGTSILGLMSLAAEPGARLVLTATGADAGEALRALATLIADRFGEEE